MPTYEEIFGSKPESPTKQAPVKQQLKQIKDEEIDPMLGVGPESTPIDDYMGVAGQHLALAGNSALFGMTPKIAYGLKRLSGGSAEEASKSEEDINSFIHQAREDNPFTGMVAEVLGGMAVPVPGMGLGKAVMGGVKGVSTGTRLAKAVAEGAIGAGAAGAIRGAVQNYGEGGTTGAGEGIGAAIQGGKEGGVTGAILGGVLGGAAQHLAEAAGNAKIAATGTGAGEINKAYRGSQSRNKLKFVEGIKNDELGTSGILEDKRILGHHPFQSAEDATNRLMSVIDETNGQYGALVKDLSAKGAKVPSNSVGANTFQEAASFFNKDSGKAPEAKAGAEKFMNWFADQFISKPEHTLEDLMKIKSEIRNTLQGIQGSKIPGDNQFADFLKAYAKEVTSDMATAAHKVDPKGAQKLMTLSDQLHDLFTARTLMADPDIRWGAVRQTPLGKGIMSSAQAAIWHMLGLGPVASRAAAGITTAPGATPNTLIYLDRLRRSGKLGSRESVGGVLGGIAPRTFGGD